MFVVGRAGGVLAPDVERLEEVRRRRVAPAVPERLLAQLAVAAVRRLVGDDVPPLLVDREIEERAEGVEHRVARRLGHAVPGDNEEPGVAARAVDRGRNRGAVGAAAEAERLEIDGVDRERGAHLSHGRRSDGLRCCRRITGV
jgi:hypothetical protein